MKTDATILLEQDIAYDTLVQVMDTVRVFSVAENSWSLWRAVPGYHPWETRRHDQSNQTTSQSPAGRCRGRPGHATLVPFIDMLMILTVFSCWCTTRIRTSCRTPRRSPSGQVALGQEARPSAGDDHGEGRAGGWQGHRQFTDVINRADGRDPAVEGGTAGRRPIPCWRTPPSRRSRIAKSAHHG